MNFHPTSSLSTATMAGAKKRKSSVEAGEGHLIENISVSQRSNKLPERLKSESMEPDKRIKTSRQPSPPKAPRAFRENGQKQNRRSDQARHNDRDRNPRNRPKNDERREPPKVDRDSRPSHRVALERQPNGHQNDDVAMKDAEAGKRKTVTDGEEDPVTAELMRVMGFKSFKSTKNTKVAGNEGAYAVRIEKATKYRQYMNRKGGFNRPLSPS